MTSGTYCRARFWAAGAALLIVLGLPIGVSRVWSQQSGASSADKSSQTSPSQPPPLEVDLDEPLRLDTPAKPATKGKVTQAADNSPCFVCHANFRKEELASTHASNGVGCVSCHGPSIKHRNDEANIIPPDIMIPTETLEASCTRCHKRHDVAPRLVVERFLARNTGHTDLKNLICTSCHGEHH
ncbi:MAG: ammonia-forming cytochrome c nitrite reductase subunit c552, partial [Isosphaeraceae bacterium]